MLFGILFSRPRLGSLISPFRTTCGSKTISRLRKRVTDLGMRLSELTAGRSF